jgi:hypothetical protein
MAPAVTELWRSVAPEEIDTSLPDLWIDMARDSPVSRALMSNLVVVTHGALPAAERSFRLGRDSDLVRIAERHPARIILLNYVPMVGRPCAPSGASIGVLTFGDGAARYGVEVIAVEAVCAEASVPSIVRRLTRGDVPTTVWWKADLSRLQPPDAMVATGRQFLYDSADWQTVGSGARAAAAILSHPQAPDLADVNWRRLAPLRWAILHALNNEPRGAALPESATIRVSKDTRVAGWLFAAWLQRGLRSRACPTVEEFTEGDELLTAVMTGSGWTLTATMNRERVLVETSAGRPPFSMPVPKLTVADAVIADLRNLGRDTHLGETINTLANLR